MMPSVRPEPVLATRAQVVNDTRLRLEVALAAPPGSGRPSSSGFGRADSLVGHGCGVSSAAGLCVWTVDHLGSWWTRLT